jgi:ubiquinone/menaquinone biosynthesis C-methylase UbiE
MPATATLDKPQVNPWEVDRPHTAYLEFLTSLRAETLRHINQDVQKLYQQKRENIIAEGKPAPDSFEDINALVGEELPYRFNRAFARKTQEMMWTGIQGGLEPKRMDLVEYLNAPAYNVRGGLELDPDLEIPEYALHDFHLQPGAYYSQDDFSAIVYDWGGRVYFLKTNIESQTQQALVSHIPKGDYRTIVDIGCTTGATSMILAKTFPQAQVYGLDLGGHMLKLAHKKSLERGIENIIYSQQNAEHTRFADNSVDLVTAFILFHEVSPEARLNILKEVHRILKPGGYFVNGDTTPFRESPAWVQFVSSWQKENNGEPHWITNNLEANLVEDMNQVGFQNVREFGAAVSKLSAKFPWITIGQK